ncbi:MAG TPA: 50S ribosomal protein L6 [Candidatus Paceibacterota bacterium]|nr:50S ribosomal protein L6 [Candidatus Paceibacterota bacterium]
MSRVGKQIIQIPSNTEVKVSSGFVDIKGPKGTLSKKFSDAIEIKVDGQNVTLMPTKEDLETQALWGTYASHLANMIEGVNNPYVKKLVIEGIGYRAEVSGTNLVLNLGFSHQIKVEIPAELKVTVDKNILTVSGADKELVGQFASKIRAMKKPEPYKGKGIRYEKEVVRRKQGKKSV